LRHRTHRRYADKPVEERLIELLLAAAFSTPSKSDLQQCSVIRVKDPVRRQALAALLPDMPWVGLAPAFFVFCGDGRRIRRVSAMRGRQFANDHLDGFLNPAADAAMVLTTFMLAAGAMGLGCCAISVLRNHAERVAEIVGLPEAVFPFAGCCLGWPAQEGYVSLRLPPAITVHTDRYDDSRLEAEIDAYDRRRDRRFRIPQAQHKYVEEFGEAEFYGWSEDKARQTARPERADFGAFLRRRGFTLR
jgi:nitroreductase/FMN reductase [NAD(P)H]